ncbi:MAG: LuxR C-terminal-related transcriptional regulator [Pseudomonadota bacterium]
MSEIYTPVVADCTVIPADLMDFIASLDRAETSDDVWTLLVDLTRSLGITLLDYVIATDHRNWEKVQFIRTTHSSEWINFANQDPRVRRMSTFRLHSVHHLIPVCAGIGYLAPDPNLSDERRALLEETASKHGGRSGIAIPLRMTEPGQAAHMMFGVGERKEVLEDIFDRHGWTLQCAALYGHIRHMELFKSEFSQRNRLTEKQEAIIRAVGLGLTDKEITARLNISLSTVRQRINALQGKTGCKNRADLAALAMRMGLVPDPITRAHTKDLTVFLSTGDNRTGTEYVRNDT